MANIMVFGNVSLLELIWLIVNIAGLLYSISNSIDAREDYRALKVSGEGTQQDWIIVWQRARHTWISSAIEAMFVGFGVVAATSPNPPALSLGTIFVSLILLGGTALLSAGAWFDMRDRRRLRGR